MMDLDAKITESVRRADKAFEKVGGSSRHWVRECLFPALEEGGLAVVTIAEREVLAKRVEELETLVLCSQNGYGRWSSELAEEAHKIAERRAGGAS